MQVFPSLGQLPDGAKEKEMGKPTGPRAANLIFYFVLQRPNHLKFLK